MTHLTVSLARNGYPITYQATLRYVPETIGISHAGKFYQKVPVTGVTTYPPGQHPKGSCVVAECIAVEIKTAVGSRWYGATKAFIDSKLRMVMDCNDRDEVLAKWEAYEGEFKCLA